jgi:N-acetylglucosaminyl-diphospho-decaprenol L-rhamnosyltransferase
MASARPPGSGPRRIARPLAPHSRPRSAHAPSVVPLISVVIVNFCQWRNTARLVRQLRSSDAARAGAAEIIVVDNHSPSHSAIKNLKRTPGVTIRRFSRNYGFARAVNLGYETARGGWTLLLNPDVSVPDGFLDDVQTAADRLEALEPQAGVIGFQLRNHDGSQQASSGIFPTFWSSLAGLVRRRSRRKCEHRSLDERQSVPWVTGGCLLVKRACFQQLGGLDERFFLYYEDVDFCRRAREKGWSVWYEPAVRVTHHWPLHARRVPAPLRLMTRHALLTYARMHWPCWQSRTMAGVVWLEAKLRAMSAAVRGDRDSARLYRQLGSLVGDVLHGRFDDVRRRIRNAAAFLDPIAAEQDGRTE